jgi:hypothetical protein
MNTLPEWFTVEAERWYEVADQGTGISQSFTGQDLRDGFPAEAKPARPLRLTVLSK